MDQDPEAGAEHPLRSGARWPRTVGRAALVLAVIAVVVFGIDLATRPPCPDRYVRLVDVEAFVTFLTAVLAIGSFAVDRVSHRPGPHRVAGVVGVGLLALSLLAGVVAGAWTVRHQSPDWNSSSECWTF